MLSGILVVRLGKAADYLFKDVAHLQIGDFIRVQICVRGGKLFDDNIQNALVCHSRDVPIELELLQNIPNIGGEAIEVVPEIILNAVWLIQQTLEGVLADIVKRMSGDLPEQHIPHGQFFDFLILCPHCILGVGQNAVKAADHGQGQDDLAVFVGLVHPGQLIGDGPNKPRLFMDIRA